MTGFWATLVSVILSYVVWRLISYNPRHYGVASTDDQHTKTLAHIREMECDLDICSHDHLHEYDFPRPITPVQPKFAEAPPIPTRTVLR